MTATSFDRADADAKEHGPPLLFRHKFVPSVGRLNPTRERGCPQSLSTAGH
jgi:hypothetical protein